MLQRDVGSREQRQNAEEKMAHIRAEVLRHSQVDRSMPPNSLNTGIASSTVSEEDNTKQIPSTIYTREGETQASSIVSEEDNTKQIPSTTIYTREKETQTETSNAPNIGYSCCEFVNPSGFIVCHPCPSTERDITVDGCRVHVVHNRHVINLVDLPQHIPPQEGTSFTPFCSLNIIEHTMLANVKKVWLVIYKYTDFS